MEAEGYVVDTSALIIGAVTKIIKEQKIRGTIVIPRAAISELEHQANHGREEGFNGLQEIKKLKQLEQQHKITIEIRGKQPTEQQIKRAKSGGIDSLIREQAWEEGLGLITADKIQGEIAETLGIPTIIVEEAQKISEKLELEKFFDEKTMSIHLKENVPPYAKKGTPGKFEFQKISEQKLTKEELKKLAQDATYKANYFDHGFVEINRKGSTIIQYADYRIVITRPPFSDGWEITAVKPLVELNLTDYDLPPNVMERFEKRAEGILISGAPGSGKTTFSKALAEFYESKGKIVKTIESPRDLKLKPEITQYSKNFGTSEEIHDVLLLSRPDYTIFDEVRDTKDFKLYTDLRLSGIGMVGVLHSTTPINAIQRFIGRLELGMIPSVLDTVVFINKGKVETILELRMVVRVPTGMTDDDLARPIVEVQDFNTKKLMYEIYTYGEQTVVVPVNEIKPTKSQIKKIAQDKITEKIKQLTKGKGNVKVEITGENSIKLYVNEADVPKIIGKKGKNITKLENQLGLKIDVQTLNTTKGEEIEFTIEKDPRYVLLIFDTKYKGRKVTIFINNEFLMDAIIGRKGIIKITKNSETAKKIITYANTNLIKAYI